jgi:hypothetical protein
MPIADSSAIPLIATIAVAIFASVTAPLLIYLLMGRQTRATQKAEWDRQDARDKERKEREDAVAEEAKGAAAKTAATLLAANGEVASALVETNGVTNDKLDILDKNVERVHTLVNSDKTAAMQRDLDSAERELILLEEIVDLKAAAGAQPKPETLGAIDATRRKIAELLLELEDRHRQAALAEKQIGEKR